MAHDRQKYEADVAYEVWWMGGNPDAINPDLVDNYQEIGYWPEEAAACVLNQQRPQHPEED